VVCRVGENGAERVSLCFLKGTERVLALKRSPEMDGPMGGVGGEKKKGKTLREPQEKKTKNPTKSKKKTKLSWKIVTQCNQSGGHDKKHESQKTTKGTRG